MTTYKKNRRIHNLFFESRLIRRMFPCFQLSLKRFFVCLVIFSYSMSIKDKPVYMFHNKENETQTCTKIHSIFKPDVKKVIDRYKLNHSSEYKGRSEENHFLRFYFTTRFEGFHGLYLAVKIPTHPALFTHVEDILA